jgi:two-component system phosphate regulon response regulator PhoB
MSTPSILLVDDDPDFVEITTAILETKQYQVRSAQDPDEGLAMLEEEIPDLLILDVMMGRGAGGFVLARKIRNKVPILMLTSMTEQTGFDIPGQRISEKFLPVDDYIEKGLKPHELLEKIEQQLAKKAVD